MSSESESQKASEPSDPDSQSASVQFVSVDGVVKKTNPRRKPSGGSVNLNELETVSLPDDPTANDIYSLSPGSNYQPLPSLVPNQFEDSSLFVDVNNPHLSVSDSDHTSTCDRKTKKKTCASLKGKPCGKPPCKFCHLLNESIADMENLSSSSLDAENGNRSADIATIVESNYFNANFTKDKEDHIDPTSPPKTPNFNNFHNFHCPEFVRPGTSSSDHLSVNSDSHDTSTASSDKSFSIIQEDFLDDYDIAMRLQQCERNIVDKNLKDEKNRGTSSATVSLQPEQDDAYLSQSWVDLANHSNPATPPHPLQREHQLSAARQELVASSLPSTSGETVATTSSSVISDIPPALPHVTGTSSMAPAVSSSSFPSQSDDLPLLFASSPICGSDVSSSSSSAIQRLSFGNGEDSDTVGPLSFSEGTYKLLKEAQRESLESSARVSLASSRRGSLPGSPRSPPNSPNLIEGTSSPFNRGPYLESYEGVCYINYYSQHEDNYVRVERRPNTDWIWDWSSRPDQMPPKEWNFSHPASTASGSSAASHAADADDAKLLCPAAGLLKRRGASLRHVRIGKASLFSKEVLYTILLTNVLSLILGTGIGVWLSRKSAPSFPAITAMPFL